MPDRLFVLDVIQHQFINLPNLSLTEKQKSWGQGAGEGGCFILENFPQAFSKRLLSFLRLSTGVQMWTQGHFLSTEVL